MSQSSLDADYKQLHLLVFHESKLKMELIMEIWKSKNYLVKDSLRNVFICMNEKLNCILDFPMHYSDY